MGLITLKEPFLYRGSSTPLSAGDTIKRPDGFDPEGQGWQVYASSNYWHAATYGLTDLGSCVIGQWDVGGEMVPAILLGTKGTEAEVLQKIRDQDSFVAKLDVSNFTPMLARAETGKEFPAEWKTKTPVKALSIDTWSGDDLIRNGVQVFTATPEFVKAMMSNKTPFTPKNISAMLKNGLVNWINANSIYDDAPKARPNGIHQRLGLQEEISPSRPAPKRRAHTHQPQLTS